MLIRPAHVMSRGTLLNLRLPCLLQDITSTCTFCEYFDLGRSDLGGRIAKYESWYIYFKIFILKSGLDATASARATRNPAYASDSTVLKKYEPLVHITTLVRNITILLR